VKLDTAAPTLELRVGAREAKPNPKNQVSILHREEFAEGLPVPHRAAACRLFHRKDGRRANLFRWV